MKFNDYSAAALQAATISASPAFPFSPLIV